MRFEELDSAHQKLQSELRQQQEVTSEVKQDASNFLLEMRTLSQRSGENSDREEQLVKQVHRLEEEVNEWRNRYTQAKGQLRTLRAPSMNGTIQQPNIKSFTRKRGYFDQDGLIRHISVARFQVAIDELLRNARTSEPQSLFAHVRSVFIYAREIIQDAQRRIPSNDDQAQKTAKFTKMISDTANNLATAVRNFSSSNGLSPICLIDAAASHVTNSVISLASVVKIQPAAPGELEDEDDNNSLIAESPAAYYGMKQYGRSSLGDESIYSSISPVQQRSLRASAQQTAKSQYTNPAAPYQDGLSHDGFYNTPLKPGLGINSPNSEAAELKVRFPLLETLD